MQTVKKVFATDIKVGDIITNHGKTNKKVVSVSHHPLVGKVMVAHEGGFINFDEKRILCVKQS